MMKSRIYEIRFEKVEKGEFNSSEFFCGGELNCQLSARDLCHMIFILYINAVIGVNCHRNR